MRSQLSFNRRVVYSLTVLLLVGHTVSMAADKFTDAAGNNNTAATQFNWTYNGTAPTMTITAKNGWNAGRKRDATYRHHADNVSPMISRLFMSPHL